jgi:hypothetical protein
MNAMLSSALPTFDQTLREHRLELPRQPLGTLQVNVGKLCNQACHHCHVEAGPKRTEIMDARTVARVLELLAAAPDVHTLDLTGGAPERNPHFRTLVRGARALGRKVSDEFAVPLCRGHHRALHRSGNERAWWQTVGIDPIEVARKLWKKTRLNDG